MSKTMPANESVFVCESCDIALDKSMFLPAKDLDKRIDIGGVYTNLECPMCGALAYPQGIFATKTERVMASAWLYEIGFRDDASVDADARASRVEPDAEGKGGGVWVGAWVWVGNDEEED